jgi:hypothetical protein
MLSSHRGDRISQIKINHTESPAMPFRMSRTLRFWVEVECDDQDLRRADDKEVAAILLSFEEQGYAFRSLNSRGDVMWKASPYFLDELAGAEAEVEAEYENER